jgi:cytoskeletal protein CcmA (bactofilin family)
MGFGKGKAGNGIQSLLSEGAEISGEVSFTNGMRVDGIINGKVHSEATLIVGSSGKMNAEVDVRRISVNGEFRGIIRASDRVEIHKEGKVYGDIYTPCLIIEAGATFEGRCNMSETVGENAADESSRQDIDS